MKAGVCVGILVDADGKDDQVGLVVVKIEERWQLDDAGLAPGGPEVEQDHPAPVARQVNGGGAVGDGEVGSASLPVWAGWAPRLQADNSASGSRKTKKKHRGNRTSL
jgi:hypothetical protein